MSINPVVSDLLRRVEEVRPVIEAHAAEAEAQRHMSRTVHDALVSAGLYGMLQPKAHGGMELHPSDAMAAWEAVARIDAATAWNLEMTGVNTAFVGFLPPEGANEIMAHGPTTVAGALFPPASGRRVDGGWRVTGRVPFGSGCHSASWRVIPMMEMADGQPVDGAVFAAFFPASEGSILDTWHTIGMRGTGSADIQVQDLFIPARRVTPVGPLTNPAPGFEGPLFRFWPLTGVLGEATVATGIAQAAVDELVTLAATKTPAYNTVALKDQQLAQVLAGKAQARVNAARDTLVRAASEAYDCATCGHLTEPVKLRMQAALTFATEANADAVRLVYDAAGSSAIRTENRFERHLRDVSTLTQHAARSTSRYASVGRLMFGLPNDWVWLSF